MIARALASHPKVLILTSRQRLCSSRDVELLFEVVHRLKEKGTAVIFVTHKMAEILELTDRVTILRDGKISVRLSARIMTQTQLSRT